MDVVEQIKENQSLAPVRRKTQATVGVSVVTRNRFIEFKERYEFSNADAALDALLTLAGVPDSMELGILFEGGQRGKWKLKPVWACPKCGNVEDREVE